MSITIIVPTHNRSRLLKGCLEFIRGQDSNIEIIVADSSSEADKILNRTVIERIGSNVIYIEFDPAVLLVEKLSRVVGHVSTPFVCACADDDYIIVKSASRCVDYLVRNPEYVACHGRYLHFSLVAPGQIRLDHWEYRGPSLDGDRPSKRVMDLLVNYEALFYAVQSTSTFRMSLDAMKTSPFNMLRELAGALWIAMAGKVKRLDSVYYLRQAGDSSMHPLATPENYLAKRFPTIFSEYASMATGLIEKFQHHYQSKVEDGLFDVLCFGFLVHLYKSIDLVDLAKLMIPRYPVSDLARLRRIRPPTWAPTLHRFRMHLRGLRQRIAHAVGYVRKRIRPLTEDAHREGYSADAHREGYSASKGASISISRKLLGDLPKSVRSEIEEIFARGGLR